MSFIKKSLVLSTLYACLFPMTSYANITPSQINQITIYQGKASVQRSLPIQAIGEQQIVFDCLSGKIDKDSIQVNAPQGVNIGEINVQTLTNEQAKLCQQQGNENLANTQSQLDAVNAKIKSNELTLKYLTNLGNATSINIAGTIDNSAKSLQQTATTVLTELQQLEQQKAKLEHQLMNNMNDSGTVSNRVTKVNIRLASRQTGQVTLNYLVDGASWQPQYQARLDSNTGKITFDLQALIAQNTGENWQNIPLILSTIQPSYQTTIRDPYPKNLNLYDPKANTTSYEAMDMLPMPAPAMEPASYSLRKSKEETEPLPSYQASISNKNDIVEYQLPQRVTLPSDGRRITSHLDSQTGDADIWVRVVPENSLTAYWYAKAPFLNKNWVAGNLRLYRDGNYIGTGKFELEQVKNKGLGFGDNKKILVTELVNENKTDTTGLFSKKGIKQIATSYRITNQLPKATNIEVVSGLPVAQDGQISIKSAYNPEPNVKDWQDKKGVIAWKFQLQPQQQQQISQQHTIQYPNDKDLTGL